MLLYDLSFSTTTITKNRVRGLARGMKDEKTVKRHEKLEVRVLEGDGAPMGVNAPSIRKQIGVEVRNTSPLQGVTCWSEIDFRTQVAVTARIQDKFEIVNYDEDEFVRYAIHRKCARRYRSWRSKMYIHYKKLLKDGVDPKMNPYGGVTPRDWKYMIDDVWSGEKFKVEEKGGERSHITDFFKSSHWSKKKNDWVDPKCKEKYEKFVELKEKSSQPNAPFMSLEEMSIEVFGKRSGHIVGWG